MSKLYLINKTLLILLICQVFIFKDFISLAKSLPSDDLKKVIDSVESTAEEKGIKEVKVDPSQNYKLVAIYILDKEPRALIKSLANPDAGTVEFKVGDFLDEFQTISVSKISFNPTAKVELIDQDGVSYFIKPQAVSEKPGAGSSKSTYSRSLPSHFSAKTDKSKIKKTETPAQADQTEGVAATKKEEASSAISGTKATEQGSATQEESASLKPALPTSQESTQIQASAEAGKPKAEQPKDAVKPQTGAGLGRDRPSNPFGE